MALANETISTLAEAMTQIYDSNLIELVLLRLESFGCVIAESDGFCICFSVQKVENSIKNICGVAEVPKELTNIAVDMVCGEVLGTIYSTGRLSIESLDLDGAIASVSAGDTSVSFDNAATDAGKFRALLQMLQHGGRGELSCYRRLRW